MKIKQLLPVARRLIHLLGMLCFLLMPFWALPGNSEPLKIVPPPEEITNYGNPKSEQSVQPIELVEPIETIKPIKQSPVPIKQSPVPIKQSPVPIEQSPMPIKQSPAPVKQTPTPKLPVQKPGETASPVVEKFELKEFHAKPLSEKSAMGKTGKGLLFYSDPKPIVSPPPPKPEHEVAYNEFEHSRELPVIDAPAGLFNFAGSSEVIHIVASHSYDNVQIKAGKIVAFNMLIANKTRVSSNYRERIVAPPGIRGVHEIAPFEIPAGKIVVRRVSLFLDSSLSPGVYRVSYQMKSSLGNEICGSLAFSFAIKASPELGFELISSVEVKESSPFKVLGRLSNNGNVDLYLQLELSGQGKKLSVLPARISLPAKGHATIELSGLAPARSHPLDDLLQLNLSAISDKESGSLQLLNKTIQLRLRN